VLICLSLSGLILSATWVLGGRVAEYQGAMIAMTLLVWIIMLAQRKTARIGRDPVFWLIFAFWMLLLSQAWNTGRVVGLDGAFIKITAPPITWLPSSFNRWAMVECITWYLPITTVLLAIRHGLDVKWRTRLLKTLVISGVLFALLGVAGRIVGPIKILWLKQLNHAPFGAFAYENHAAGLMLLLMCVCMSLRWWSLIPLYALAIWFTECDAIILLTIVILAIAGIKLITSFKAYKHEGLALPLVRTLVILVARLAQERRDKLEIMKDHRLWQIKAAHNIWKDHRLFGAGSHAFYFLGTWYTERADVEAGHGDHCGNVHNSYATGLAEFGLMGMGIAMLVFIRCIDLTAGWMLLGAGALMIHGMVDIPFSNPAVFMTWILMTTKTKESER